MSLSDSQKQQPRERSSRNRKTLIEPNLRAAADLVPARWKRLALYTFYVVAEAQRRYGEDYLPNWPRPEPKFAVPIRVVTFSCERDRLLVTRMIWSLLREVGQPIEILVVSDGTLSTQSIAAIERLNVATSVVDWTHFVDLDDLPSAVVAYAEHHPLGKKLAVLLSLRDWPVMFVDSDIEFFTGGDRLRAEVSAGDRGLRYLEEPTRAYDERLLLGRQLRDGINSGFFIASRPLIWEEGLTRLGNFGADGGEWTEQTVFALAADVSGGRPLPPEDYVVYWDDIKWPWDHIAGRNVVLRHYLSYLQRWKLWMRGGPMGYKSVPIATVRLVRSQFTHPPDVTRRSP